jgi:3-oxoacyl-[acyl-carrier protein] reductase
MTDSSRLALVTGASRGIGKAIAIELAARGFTVLFTYLNNKDMAEELVTHLKSLSCNEHEAFCCDMMNSDHVRAMFRKIHTSRGAIRVLVNNVGSTGSKKLFLMTPEEEWQDTFFYNLTPMLTATRCCLQKMIVNKKGTIINIGSVSAKGGTPGSTAYSASKAALIAFSKALQREMGGAGIKIICVSPGIIATDLVKEAGESFIRNRVESSPLKRMGRPEEVASLVGYLADESPELLGGQNIWIDGLQV